MSGFLCAGLCRWLCEDGFVYKCLFLQICGILWVRWFVVVHALVWLWLYMHWCGCGCACTGVVVVVHALVCAVEVWNMARPT